MHLQTFPDPGTDPRSCTKSQGSATGRGQDDTAGRTFSPSFFSCPPFPSLVPQLLWSLCTSVRHHPRDVLSLARAESVLVLAKPLQGHKHHHDQFLSLQGQAASLKTPVNPAGNILWRTKLDVKEQKDLSSGRCPDLGRRKAL